MSTTFTTGQRVRVTSTVSTAAEAEWDWMDGRLATYVEKSRLGDGHIVDLDDAPPAGFPGVGGRNRIAVAVVEPVDPQESVTPEPVVNWQAKYEEAVAAEAALVARIREVAQREGYLETALELFDEVGMPRTRTYHIEATVRVRLDISVEPDEILPDSSTERGRQEARRLTTLWLRERGVEVAQTQVDPLSITALR